MAESSFPWTDGTGDGGPYAANTWDDIYRYLFTTDQHATEGVLLGVGGELEVTGTSSPLSVAAGAAIVNGKIYINTSAVSVSVPTPSSASRIDLVILRADYSARTVRVVRLAGTEGGSAPTLTQTDGTTWEIPLAQVSITTGGVITLTDKRTFCHFGTEVTTDMIADQAVTAAKIADATITPTQLAAYAPGGFIWTVGGTLSTGTNLGMRYRPNGTITHVEAELLVKTAPTGSAVIVDINKNGVSLFASGNRPQIAVGNTEGESTTFNITTGDDDDVYTIDIDQADSSGVAADLAVILHYKRPLSS